MKTALTRSLFWLAALTAALSASAAFSRGSGSLVANATPVPGTKGRAASYFWVNHGSVITLPNPSNGILRPMRIDPRSGAVTPLPPIAPALTQGMVRGSYRASANGERLLWARQTGPTYHWVIQHLDSGKTFTHNAHPFDPFRRPSAEFHPDGRSWVELRPVNGHYYSVVNDPLSGFAAKAKRLVGLTDPAQILSVSAEGGVTAMIRQPMSYWQGEMARIDVGTGEVTKTKAPIPPEMGAMGIAVSPETTRMALMLWNREPSSGFRLLGPLLSELGIRDQRIGSLRVIDPSGTNLGDLGTMQWMADRRRWRRGGAMQLKWTPDGKRLSFIHQDQLYTIPAP